ncbi:MAG: hypothetical protein A2Z20_01635 [Bdellovibrionales bacterium RBG_16_40_8]|nr:MAG: hypothetical protein A2Z20_01635 [Bdellovibrionales bacterium RBG_16_40_8]
MAHSTSAQQFDRHAKDYDQWFDKNPDVFKAEVNAILSLAPPFENSLEIGVGSGRFAAALGIRHGIDPAPQMLSLARARGIDATIGEAEHLPFTDERYDSAFMITSLCFMRNQLNAMKEAHRVLKANGILVIAFIPKNSQLGIKYRKDRSKDSLYRLADFFSYSELLKKLKTTGFSIQNSSQTLLNPNLSLDVLPGHARGSFVVVSARKLTCSRA